MPRASADWFPPIASLLLLGSHTRVSISATEKGAMQWLAPSMVANCLLPPRRTFNTSGYKPTQPWQNCISGDLEATPLGNVAQIFPQCWQFAANLAHTLHTQKFTSNTRANFSFVQRLFVWQKFLLYKKPFFYGKWWSKTIALTGSLGLLCWAAWFKHESHLFIKCLAFTPEIVSHQ